jgi:hypothetical protein
MVRPVRYSFATMHRTAGRSPSGAENSKSQSHTSEKGSAAIAQSSRRKRLRIG